jgi:hypothetical protein
LPIPTILAFSLNNYLTELAVSYIDENNAIGGCLAMVTPQ